MDDLKYRVEELELDGDDLRRRVSELEQDVESLDDPGDFDDLEYRVEKRRRRRLCRPRRLRRS